jgi:ferritin-like metal-binding protein YciE
MATATERINCLLLDAHAVEKQAKTMLDALARRIENYPDVKAQIERHLREGREQAAALQGYVGRHADATPNWKDSTGQSVAMGQGLSGAFVGDKFVKRAMIEISCYNILLGAAAAVGDSETRAVCEDILRQEEAMAEWLRKYIASATMEYLGRKEMPDGEAPTLSKP